MPIWLFKDINRGKFRDVIDFDPETCKKKNVGFLYPEEKLEHSDCHDNNKSEDVRIPFELDRDIALKSCTFDKLIEKLNQQAQTLSVEASTGNKYEYLWTHMNLKRIPSTGKPQHILFSKVRDVVIEPRRQNKLSEEETKRLDKEFDSLYKYRDAMLNGTNPLSTKPNENNYFVQGHSGLRLSPSETNGNTSQ